MKNEHGPLIYEGKAKRIFETDQVDRVIMEFKDDATAFNALKRSVLKGKGELNCQISAHLFEFLEKNNVPTHFVGLSADHLMEAQRIDVLPLEVVIRNIATGSLCKQTPIEPGSKLSPPLLDIYYKDDDLGDPLLTDQRLKILNIINEEQRLGIEKLARRVNELLQTFFLEVDLVLVDFKLEIGFNLAGKMLVADEISPDTCRLWDQRNQNAQDRILDKDRFRKDLGGVIEAYGEILKRIQGITNKDLSAGKVTEG